MTTCDNLIEVVLEPQTEDEWSKLRQLLADKFPDTVSRTKQTCPSFVLLASGYQTESHQPCSRCLKRFQSLVVIERPNVQRVALLNWRKFDS